MKIAFLHMTMGLVERGSESVIDQLATELAKKHEVLAIQAGKPTAKAYRVKQVRPLNKVPHPAPRNLLDKLLFRLHVDEESGKVIEFSRAAIDVLQDFKPDIVIAVNGSLQIRLLKSLKTKIVAFGHAGIGYHDKHSLLAGPDLFIALTESAYSWAHSIAKTKTKVAYIPNPINLKSFEHPKKVKLNLAHPIIMTVSALSAYKNVQNVVEAVRATSASYLLIGDGEESTKISSSLSTLMNSFLWVKHVPQVEMPPYFATADIFCFIPDHQEAFGMVYLEAMAAGLPIVASDDEVRRSIIGPHGIFVNPHDVDSVTQGIIQALGRGKIDYSKQLSRFTLKNIIKDLEKEFYELV